MSLTGSYINNRSLNGIITITDGQGSIIENGIIVSNTLNTKNLSANSSVFNNSEKKGRRGKGERASPAPLFLSFFYII
jgi:hypothetical protein